MPRPQRKTTMWLRKLRPQASLRWEIILILCFRKQIERVCAMALKGCQI